MYIETLLEDIENYRRKMVQLASHYSFTNQQVIEISTELDKLLNQYYLLTVRNETDPKLRARHL
ncbi:aspartyl-phosphate phosphatase Spo0E family protein [Bacillus methanolicus]|uniref:aspartyl-phosphate phosphatase Spo0E family protein n=1 Tax=Bacillus methanolicus TaxID=1471 RepID=UPI00200C0B7E|nr:aspartyl-phosphate phosphatase Spo0E family protein [Bacillus methanolicus]UQD50789.1 aspartyl-phosphate phosphatase Spo0E family protein [Bacillus methanolicus]